MQVAAKFALLSLVSAALHLPVRKVYPSSDSPIARRTVDTSIIGNGIIFVADIEVGTPPQKQSVLVDTGSSDLWFTTPGTCNTDADGNAPSSERPIRCDNVYDTSQSSTFVNGSIPFAIGYADNTGSSGFYAQDTLTVAGATLTSANIAYALEASTPSIMGIGFMKGEACVSWVRTQGNDTATVDTDRGCPPYENLPQQLKSQGKISSTAYSLWLNDLSSQQGNVLFGGVDHAKYLGQLVTLPIEQTPHEYSYPPPDGEPLLYFEKYNRVLVTLNEINIVAESGASEILLSGAVPVLLDTGSTECSIPSALVDSFAKAFNAVPDSDGYYINCGVGNKVYVGLNFRGLEIQVPLSQFLRPYSDFYGNYLVDTDGTELCRLGGSANDESSYLILGDNVLSSLYSVIDLERGEVALAPAIFNQYETDIEDIVDSIPRAVQAPAYSYSFSSHLTINPTPTLQLDVTPTTSVYGITGPYITEDLKGDESGVAQAAFTAYIVDAPILGFDVGVEQKDDANTTTTTTSTSSLAYSYGITNIIETGIPTGLPEGINSVYSAGAPSTFGVVSSTLNSTTNISSTAPTSVYSGATSNFTQASTLEGQTAILTTYLAQPTTFTWNSTTITVTEATTLTIGNCPDDGPNQAQDTNDLIAAVVTQFANTTAFDTAVNQSGYETSPFRETTTAISGHPVVNYTTSSGAIGPAEITEGLPSAVASNSAVQTSLCGAMLLMALL